MGMIKVKHKGSFRKTERFFDRALSEDYLAILHHYGSEGVRLLSEATPVGSGETAASWSYEIERGKGTTSLVFINSHENRGVNVVKLIVFGHGMWNGGYVAGNDFVTPAMHELLTRIANEVWREVTK